ncbi:hypothetical protein OS493_024028 [Desmophyllum pertusum]|uniref:Uncharacterized protein n=1 Tax=Desmophyllum pertusum TaxID=174260 RepID=A0A9W9ZLQ2_9CNID|nr:hypothetical protein OS493_024028 [Desmophyllum pertusum]
MTTNIESQEHRRRENNIIGYAEHPRAGGTDDLETFFSIAHRYLGLLFTLKQFKEKRQKLVREFCKRMDHTLPFYFFTLNERFRGEEDYPSFDDCPEGGHFYLLDTEAQLGSVYIALFWDNHQYPITCN